jgi:tRNA(Ser,Leu) C12 N-acetylase TAN1
MEEETRLSDFLLESLTKTGAGAHVTFDNPDAIVAVETIGQDAGLSLWSREELQRYPFLRLD